MYPAQRSEDEKQISVYYAPFDNFNASARVIFVGITPGASQMSRAWVAAKQASRMGTEVSTAISEVKRVSSFNDKRGQMRPNLYKQIEHWRIHKFLGLPSGRSLFEEGWPLVHATSLVAFPTFKAGANYVGSPSPLQHPFLFQVIREQLLQEFKKLESAIIFPLGPKVASVIQALQQQGLITQRIAYGLLHPSGNNTYRINYLTGPRNSGPPHATSVKEYDSGRSTFLAAYG